MNRGNLHVSPAGKNRFVVRQTGGKRALRAFLNLEEAQMFAELRAAQQKCRVYLHSKSGRVVKRIEPGQPVVLPVTESVKEPVPAVLDVAKTLFSMVLAREYNGKERWKRKHQADDLVPVIEEFARKFHVGRLVDAGYQLVPIGAKAEKQVT